MTAEEAINLYKSRDVSEKLFRGDKSYMGARAERVYGNVSLETKLFIELIALIIRTTTLGLDPFTQKDRLNLRSREIIPRLRYKSLTVTTANP